MRRLIAAAGIAAVMATGVATPADAHGGDTRHCVTRGELARVQFRMPQTHVERILDGHGRWYDRVHHYPDGSIQFVREYTACFGHTSSVIHYVDVRYFGHFYPDWVITRETARWVVVRDLCC